VACLDFAASEIEVLKYLLCSYDVRLNADVDLADVIICRDNSRNLSKPAIKISRQPEPNRTIETTNNEDGIVDLPYDLIGECLARYERAMEPRISLRYRLITRLPIQYNTLPSSIRSRFLKMQKIDADLSKHLRNEIARRTLINAFGHLGFSLRRRRPPELLITHDIDSERGLRRAEAFHKIEEGLRITSTWFLPSDDYPISRTDAEELGENSRIGSHDVKHDGRLIHIKTHDKLVERLMSSKRRLETIFGREVSCFRSPLMQFNRKILRALGDAGYKCDFSIPCWEPVHPTTMGGFGIESAQSFEIDNVIEYPLTLFQDHQLLNVLGMSTQKAAKFILEQAALIRSFDGDIVLSVHPDYKFSEDLPRYRQLLISLQEMQNSDIQRAAPPLITGDF
jgi:hypothetical protein